MMGTPLYASTTGGQTSKISIPKKEFLRMIDSKEGYGKSCESYSYITPIERFKLLKKKNFMLGDMLSESLSISHVESEYLLDSNLTECDISGMDVSEYTYKEDLEYLGENIVTIEVLQYVYGTGAAHGNGHVSHYVYDREYGMEINWEDLFGEDDAFALYVLKRVVKELASEEFISSFQTKEKLLNFMDPGYFAITEGGLLIQFGKYEIAPGASGLPSLTVPKKVLKKYMSEEMYQKCFLTKEQIFAEAMNAF